MIEEKEYLKYNKRRMRNENESWRNISTFTWIKRKNIIVPTDAMIKSDEQIEGIRQASIANSKVLDAVSNAIRPLMTTEEIDQIVNRTSKELGGYPAPLGYEGFPKSCCTSINDQVCHGIPSKRIF